MGTRQLWALQFLVDPVSLATSRLTRLTFSLLSNIFVFVMQGWGTTVFHCQRHRQACYSCLRARYNVGARLYHRLDV